jgi:hypothetical protein
LHDGEIQALTTTLRPLAPLRSTGW